MPTSYIALYAAFLSTIGFAWQVFTFVRSGPRLRLTIGRNMKKYGGLIEDNKTYLVFNVANVGNGDTTITHVVLYGFDGMWARLRNRHSWAALVNHPQDAQPIPYVLKAGQTFMSLCHQDGEIERRSRDTYLYGVVIHSGRRSALMQRIEPIEPVKQI